MSITDIITLSISGIALCFSVFATVMNVWQERKKNTIEAFRELQKETLDHLYFYTKKQICEIAENNRSEEYKKITLYLARIEHFCVGINTHVYANNIVQKLAKECIVPLYDKLMPMIEAKRKVRGAQNVYSNFEKTVSLLREK